MKRKTIQLNRITGQANSIQNGLLNLEAGFEEVKNMLTSLRIQVRDLGESQSYLNPYVREKLKRLDALLVSEQEHLDVETHRRLNAMHRQLTRILDSDVSDLFGNAIHRRLNRISEKIVTGENRSDLERKGDRRNHLFLIDGVSVLVIGDEIKSVENDRIVRIYEFPRNDAMVSRAEKEMPRKSLLIQTTKSTVYKIRFDEKLTGFYHPGPIRPETLSIPHPFFSGKIKVSGRNILVLKPDPEGPGIN